MSSIVERVAFSYITATLPWGYRLATALTRLAVDATDALGQVVYAEFLRSGVQGLRANRLVHGPGDVRHLTPKELRAAKTFGGKAYRLLLSKLGDPALVDDAVQGLLVRVAERGLPLLLDTPLVRAEAYVTKALLNAGRDLLRQRQRQRQHETPGVEGLDLEDAAAFARLQGLLPKSQITALLRSLAEVHRRAPGYVELLLQGYKPAEIARRWGVSHPYVAKWLARYGPQIQRAVRRHVEARQTT